MTYDKNEQRSEMINTGVIFLRENLNSPVEWAMDSKPMNAQGVRMIISRNWDEGLSSERSRGESPEKPPQCITIAMKQAVMPRKRMTPAKVCSHIAIFLPAKKISVRIAVSASERSTSPAYTV